MPLYAQTMIPEVWVIDGANQLIVQYTRPGNNGYQLIQQMPRGATLVSETLAGLSLDVNAILGSQD